MLVASGSPFRAHSGSASNFRRRTLIKSRMLSNNLPTLGSFCPAIFSGTLGPTTSLLGPISLILIASEIFEKIDLEKKKRQGLGKDRRFLTLLKEEAALSRGQSSREKGRLRGSRLDRARVNPG